MLQLDLPKNVTTKTTYLVAVSGGVDSMVLAHCMHNAGHHIVLAHANFQLRGEESTADAAFVQQWATANNIRLFSTRFATTSFAKLQGESIQMAARDLRYQWFSNLCELYGFQWIVTGHHLDDQWETFLINAHRGSGNKGLLGIPHQQFQRLRPLRNYTKAALYTYAEKHNLQWREDASNKEDKYLRNRLRNNLIPELNAIFPNATSGIQQTLNHLQEAQTFINFFFKKWLENNSSLNAHGRHIELAPLLELKPLLFSLHQLFHNFGFNAKEVEKLLLSSSGKHLSSATHFLYKERTQLVLTESGMPTDDCIWIDSTTRSVTHPIRLHFQKTAHPIAPPFKAHQAILDAKLLKYPLKLRKWQKGDYFYPMGMKGKKMLSKYFKDEKYSALQKQNQWLLCSNENIVWVIGKRCDRRFTASSTTTEHLILTLQQ